MAADDRDQRIAAVIEVPTPEHGDEEFDRLLSASSLGAPVVEELAARTPASVVARAVGQARRRTGSGGARASILLPEVTDVPSALLPVRATWTRVTVREWLPSMLREDPLTISQFPGVDWQAMLAAVEPDGRTPHRSSAEALPWRRAVTEAAEADAWLAVVWEFVARLEELCRGRTRPTVVLAPPRRSPQAFSARAVAVPWIAAQGRATEDGCNLTADRERQSSGDETGSAPAPDLGLGHSDQALVRRVALGDTSAIESLYDRYGRSAYALARQITGDVALAEAVVQDAFLALWRKPAEYEPGREGSLSWSLTAIHHGAPDVVRRVEPVRSRREQPEYAANCHASPDLTIASGSSRPPGYSRAWTGPHAAHAREVWSPPPERQGQPPVPVYDTWYHWSGVAERTATTRSTTRAWLLACMRRLEPACDEEGGASRHRVGKRPEGAAHPGVAPAGDRSCRSHLAELAEALAAYSNLGGHTGSDCGTRRQMIVVLSACRGLDDVAVVHSTAGIDQWADTIVVADSRESGDRSDPLSRTHVAAGRAGRP
jgi:DNA-directed RNA polymerase specialized sigma24 family protein